LWGTGKQGLGRGTTQVKDEYGDAEGWKTPWFKGEKKNSGVKGKVLKTGRGYTLVWSKKKARNTAPGGEDLKTRKKKHGKVEAWGGGSKGRADGAMGDGEGPPKKRTSLSKRKKAGPKKNEGRC